MGVLEIPQPNLKADLSLWVDTPPKVACTQRFVERCAVAGFKELVVMIDDAPKRWKPSWSLKDMEQFIGLVDKHAFGTKVGIVTWPWPDRVLIDTMYADLTTYYALNPDMFCSDESDLEMNWKTSKVLGFYYSQGKTAYDLAGDYFIKRKREVAERYGLRSEGTTFQGHTELGVSADVVPDLDVVFGQMYGVRTRKITEKGVTRKITIPLGHIHAPGRIQEISIQKARMLPSISEGKTLLGAGLPMWDQMGFTMQTKGKTVRVPPAEIMDLQFVTCVNNGVSMIREWSSKHGVDNSKSNKNYKKSSWEWLVSLHDRNMINVPNGCAPLDTSTYTVRWIPLTREFEAFTKLGALPFTGVGASHEEALTCVRWKVQKFLLTSREK